MADLSLSRLDKHYGTYHAVKAIDLDVADGEFVAHVGPSGCGCFRLSATITAF